MQLPGFSFWCLSPYPYGSLVALYHMIIRIAICIFSARNQRLTSETLHRSKTHGKSETPGSVASTGSRFCDFHFSLLTRLSLSPNHSDSRGKMNIFEIHLISRILYHNLPLIATRSFRCSTGLTSSSRSVFSPCTPSPETKRDLKNQVPVVIIELGTNRDVVSDRPSC